MVEFDETSRKKKVDELYKHEEEALVQLLAEKYGIPAIDLTVHAIEPDALKLIPEADARKIGVAAFAIKEHDVSLAILSPQKEGVQILKENLRNHGYIPSVYLTTKQSLEHAWDYYKDVSLASRTKGGVLDIANQTIGELVQTIKSPEDIKKVVDEMLRDEKGHKVSKMLEIILAGAIGTGASDVHIEPEESNVKLRLRLDGVLHDIMFFDFDTFKLLNARIKLLSGLKLNIKNDAQDGRFSIALSDTEVEIRASMLPGAYGESIVLRILNPDNISVSFTDLGIAKKLLTLLQNEIKKPKGLILTTGPTGSGKTTTLYSFLKEVHNPGVKIITIEDPIEYHVTGITQTQTNDEKGYTFLQGLRSALRQDPDVIMIGEIRDAETAKTAIDAALTGHVVFSTLHTNSAAGAIPRLIDLEVNPKIISSALNVAIAQRLLRKICSNCKTTREANEREEKLFDAVIGELQTNGMEDALEGLTVSKPYIVGEGKGCAICNNTGYKGRTGIYEAILMSGDIEAILDKNPSEREIEKAALSQKIPTLREDGVIKILAQMTTLEELERVVEV